MGQEAKERMIGIPEGEESRFVEKWWRLENLCPCCREVIRVVRRTSDTDCRQDRVESLYFCHQILDDSIDAGTGAGSGNAKTL